MHLADGVLSLPMIGATLAGAGILLALAIKKTTPEDIPKVSLVSAAFFVMSTIHIPLGPTSAHLLLAGLLGILLGRLAPIAIFLGLVLQAVLFQHGGITALGANLLLVAIPALLAGSLFRLLQFNSFWRGFIAAALAVVLCVVMLALILLGADHRYGEGYFSMINLIALSYLPLVLIEGIVTGFAVQLLQRARPELLVQRGFSNEG